MLKKRQTTRIIVYDGSIEELTNKPSFTARSFAVSIASSLDIYRITSMSDAGWRMQSSNSMLGNSNVRMQ